MPLTLNCPSCNRKLRVPDELAGRLVKCPTCGEKFDAVASPEAAAPTLARPPAGKDAPAAPRPTPPRSVMPPPSARPAPRRDEPLEPDDEEEDQDDRPWERRGGVRRDCEPHRGPMILVLGIISTVCGGLSALSFCCGFLAIGSLAGLPLGILSWIMGARDLAKMREGVMDPEGRGNTQGGMVCGIIGTVLNSLGLLIMLATVIYMIVILASVGRGVGPGMPPPPPPGPAPVNPVPDNPAPQQKVGVAPGRRVAGRQFPDTVEGRELAGPVLVLRRSDSPCRPRLPVRPVPVG